MVMTTDEWLLVLGAIAATAATVGGVTGLGLVIWAWFDRPQPAWNVRVGRERFREVYREAQQDLELVDLKQRHRATVTIRPVGTADVHDVQVRFAGCTVLQGHDDLYTPRMGVGSEPLEFEVMIPEVERGDAHAEVVWLQLRPRRQRGQRTNLRTHEVDTWRWLWRSLRVNGRRLARTQGRWITPKGRPTSDIPVPPDATAPKIIVRSDRTRYDAPAE